jgi:hypothetical protein
MQKIKSGTVKVDYDGQEYEADVEVVIACDHNYGADADGHRGTYMEFIDDILIKEVRDKDGVAGEPSKELIDIISDVAEATYDEWEENDEN